MILLITLLIWLILGIFGYHILYEYHIHLYKRTWSSDKNFIQLLKILLGPINWIWEYVDRKARIAYWKDYCKAAKTPKAPAPSPPPEIGTRVIK